VPNVFTGPALTNPINQPIVAFQNLNLNTKNHSNEITNDLLDLGDPGSPPPSPKFDPYG